MHQATQNAPKIITPAGRNQEGVMSKRYGGAVKHLGEKLEY